MVKKLFRGRILSFKRAPFDLDDESAYSYFSDGYLLVENDKISSVGYFSQLPEWARDLRYVDYRPKLILPGFIDVHNHFPQFQIIASHGTQLMDWLARYTFPEEAKFHEYSYAKKIAQSFLGELIHNGTTTSVSFCSVHTSSAQALFEEAEKKRMCLIAGKVMMDRNAPESILDTTQSSYDDSKKLIETWHNLGRLKYAISPRFAITSSPGQLEAAGVLYSEYKDCYLQTHISENADEIILAKSLYPNQRGYLDIYDNYGLLGPRSLFGHSIHLELAEKARMAESKSVAVHCPSSNLFLGSGLFDMEDFLRRKIPVAVATDTGGGTSYSMLATMAHAYNVQQLTGYNLNPLFSFYQMTLGNAIALNLEDSIGTLDAKTHADFVVIDSCATKLTSCRMETCESLIEELFILQTLGDDRSIEAVYVSGDKAK